MKYLIIVPHVDDEIYSCMSVIDKCLSSGEHELTIAHTSSGEKQAERLAILKKHLQVAYSNDPEFIRLNLFSDGKAKFADMNNNTTFLDKLIVSHDFVFIPAVSAHQDHIITHLNCMASVRYRESMKNVQGIFEYEYMYNHDNVSSEYFLELREEALNLKIEILKDMNLIDSILSESSVNSERYVRALSTINGCRANYLYAESFKVRYLKNSIF